MHHHIITIGKAKGSPYASLIELYKNRIQFPHTLYELFSKEKKDLKRIQQDENAKIMAAIPAGAYVIALDSNGKSNTSRDFSSMIQKLQNQAASDIVYIIGGSDGLTNETLNRADKLISFGAQTWPHMLARVMLLEQIYRAQQILNGHPYHK